MNYNMEEGEKNLVKDLNKQNSLIKINENYLVDLKKLFIPI